MNKTENFQTQTIHTNGGTVVQGSVQVAGDFIGRDAYYGYTAEQVRVLIAEIRHEDQPRVWDGRVPFMGLNSFREADAHFFFGRERLVETLLERLDCARFLCVSGPSGSGKSSLVRAGLLHALHLDKLDGSDTWPVVDLMPRHDPLERLAQAMAREAKNPAAAEYLQKHGRSDPLALHKQAETLLGTDQRQRFVVFVDQFEELFTQTRDEALREAFVAQLIRAATLPEGRVTVILSLRADFVAQCAAYPDLREAMSREFQLVGSMTPDELARAISLPVLKVGAGIEPELVAQIVQDMKGEPGALPLVQFALRDLFTATATRKGSEVTLTLDAYLDRGGVDRALERHADGVLAGLDETQRQVARTVFTRVVEIGSGRADTRRVAVYDELTTGDVETAQVETVVQLLADEQARLLTTGEKMDTVEKKQDTAEAVVSDGRTVTIAHERLIDAWPWLRRLIDENREVIALQNQIAADARAWEQNRRDAGYLYSGARLATVEEQMTADDLALSPLGRDFIEAGIRRRKAAARRARLAVTGLAATALIAVAAAFFASYQARLATARQLVAGVPLAVENGEFRLATLLTLESTQREQTEDSSSQWLAVLSLGATAGRELARLEHTGVVNSVSWSPDGMRLASGSGGSVRIWDVDSGEEIVIFEGHTDRVYSVAWSPDGDRLTSASDDGSIRIWDVNNSGERLIVLEEHTDGVTSVAWSPDGSRLASASGDSVRIWDMDSGESPAILEGHTDGVTDVAWSPDGSRLASASEDETVRIWDVKGRKLLAVLDGHTDGVTGVAWSPDGSRLVSSSRDETLQVRAKPFFSPACAWIDSNFTVSEWRTYFGDFAPYRPTCPGLITPEMPPLWEDPFLTYQGWAVVIGILLLAVSLLVGVVWMLVRAAGWTVRRVRRRVLAQR